MKIFLAGTEQADPERLIQEGLIKRAFATYYYVKRSNTFESRFRVLLGTAEEIIVDSGAHSFFSSSATIKSSHTRQTGTKVEEPHKYHAGYLDFAEKYSGDVDYFAELDIGEIVTQRKVEKWRGQWVARGLAEQLIIVYHPNCEKLSHFLGLMREWPSSYVALEGMRQGRLSIDYVPIIKQCYDAGVRVHGFAMTKPKVLHDIPFYSVDSASWKAGIIYGCPNMATGAGQFACTPLRRARDYKQKEHVASVLADNSFDLDLLRRYRMPQGQLSADDRDEVLRFSAGVSYQMEDYFTAYWKGRGVDWDKQVQSSKPRSRKATARS